MPIVENPAIDAKDKDIDYQNNLPNRKTFFSVDDNSQDFRSIDASPIADDESCADPQNRTAKDNHFNGVAKKWRDFIENPKEKGKKEDGSKHMKDKTAPNIAIGQINEGEREHNQEIGEIISVASKRIGLFPKRDWQMGVILDLSIHDIYLQERLLGKKILHAEGYKKCFKNSIHADAAFIILDFGTTIGHIESNWLTPSKFRRMYVNGEEGGIIIDFISQQIIIRTGKDIQGDNPTTKEIIYTPLLKDEPLRREINNFLYDKKAGHLSPPLKISQRKEGKDARTT